MIGKAVIGLTFLVNVAVQPGIMSPDGERTPLEMSAREKSAIITPLIHRANDCVATAVARHPSRGALKITDLIVEAFGDCAKPVRAMIDAHDRYYGAGSGEQFFMGPYLDALPAVVTAIVGETANSAEPKNRNRP